MDENLERLKQQFPLLDYLRERQWSARRAGHQQEFVGLCPFHRETKPSFYVNTRKICSIATVAGAVGTSFAGFSFLWAFPSAKV